MICSSLNNIVTCLLNLSQNKMKWNGILVLVFAICLTQMGFGQKSGKGSDKPVTITGKVLNRDNNPVSGAVLYVDNVKTSTTTKNNGSYKIKVSPLALNLEVRSSEFGSSTTAISGKTAINFILERTDNLASKPDNTVKEARPQDSIKKSSRPKGKKMNTYNDIYQMIRCEVSGVLVSGRSVQIQQGHSFFGSSTPLFVVNGVIVQSIDNINPLEVKSIAVLKGTSAAIYGVNGTNGVISITLKNGTEREE
jgi:TonB-dependent SusC/RagA subfamily outer membrane receptor